MYEQIKRDKGIDKRSQAKSSSSVKSSAQIGSKNAVQLNALSDAYIDKKHTLQQKGISDSSRVYQLIGEDQEAVRLDGNKVPVAYQETDPTNLQSTKGHFTLWAENVPTLKQFETATSKFFALRSSDVVLTQIDGLLARFNQLPNSEENAGMKRELAQEIVLAAQFWLKKVNKSFLGKKPKAAIEDATNLGGNTLKLKGEEERRSGILALNVAVSKWLDSNGGGGNLEDILVSRNLKNQGVTEDHGNKDVIEWEKRIAKDQIFPQPEHSEDWNNSKAMNEDKDYVVLQNDDQKRTAKLVFRGGIAYRWQELLNPESSFGVYNSPGEKHFAMDKRGRIYTGNLGTIFFHSSLLGFGDALSAGMMSVVNGRIASISNDSGHYKPNVEAMVRVLRQLQRYGVNVGGIQVKRQSVPGLENATFTGAQVLASEHGKWPDQ